MSIRRIILLLVLTLTTFISLNAQSRVENRAKNRANQNVDRQIDKAVDKTFDKVGDLFKKKKKKNDSDEETTTEEMNQDVDEDTMTEEEQARRSQEMIGKMFGGSDEDWVPVKNDYPVSFDARIKQLKKDKEEIILATYTFDTWKTGIKMKMEDAEEMRIILDNEEGSMTSIVQQDGKKQGYKMRQRVVNIEESGIIPDDVKVTKTGETKTIDGYACTKYIVEMEDGTSTAWVTKDLDLDFQTMMQNIQIKQQKKQKGGMNPNTYFGIDGVPIESTYVSKNGKETVITNMSNFQTGSKVNRSILDTSGVEIMSMGF